MGYVNVNDAMAVAEREIARSTHPFGAVPQGQALRAAQREVARSRYQFGGLGAISAAQMNSLDSQARAKIPSQLRDLFKVTPFIPNSFKTQFLAKPVSTLIGKFQGAKTIQMINKAASKQGLYNKTTKVGGRNIKMKASSFDPAHNAMLWLILMQRNPVSAIQAALEVQWGVVGQVVAPVANAIATLVGLNQPGLKGLGAPSGAAEATASNLTDKPPATSNEPSTASSVASSIGSTAVIMTSVAAIAATMAPVLMPLLSMVTGKPMTPPTQKPPKDPSQLPPDQQPGGEKSEEGGLPAWLLPVGVGGLVGWFVLRRKK